MALIRHIANQFSPVYLKPTTLARAVRELSAPTPVNSQTASGEQLRSRGDRRCGVDRRQRNRQVLVDMRSSYPRRGRNGRRHHEGQTLSIDVYA